MPLFNSVTTSIHGTENNDLSEPSSTMDVASSLMDKNGCEFEGISYISGCQLGRYVYDEDGHNKIEFNKEGYDEYGFDREEFDRNGYDRDGYDNDGYVMLTDLMNEDLINMDFI